jgi:acetyl-CoA C-acetyltransferase
MPDALIYDHVRTPRGRGRPDGSLHEVSSVELGALVLKSLARRSCLDTSLIDDVVFGCAQPVGEQGGNIARAAVLQAGYAQSVAGQQVHRFCASALEAVNAAAAQIMTGQSLAAIGGGVESMSRTVLGADSGAWSADPLVAYQNHFAPQGIGADLIATLEGFSRSNVDGFAVESQRRAAHAWAEGYFKASVEPVRDVLGDVLLDRDEFMRPDTTLAALSNLKPSFIGLGQAGFDAIALQKYPQLEAIEHVHTGGNSSGIVDGSAAVLLGNREFGEAIGRAPRARIKAFASIGSEPTIMLTAPGPVTRKLLQRCGMSLADIDLFEINEAFAAVVMRFMRELELDPARVNVNGTVLDELERRGLGTALITLCAGNGLGTATIIERL